MSEYIKKEFKWAIRDIIGYSINIKSPYDRVHCSQWVKKLIESSINDGNISICNDYAQYLSIQVKYNRLHGIFKHPPTEESVLIPLNEHISKSILNEIPYLPPSGPIAPIITHQSSDGRAYISCKEIRQKGGGVFCYLAVSPDGFKS